MADEFSDAQENGTGEELLLGAVTQLGNVHTVGIFLEEAGYFLEDMKKDLWWLLRAAHQPSGEVFYRGCEVLEEVAPGVETIIQTIKDKFSKHVESHENQVRAKITIIPSVTQEEMEVLIGLRRLKFHCKGQIEVFLSMKEANNAAIWGAYHNHVASVQPQWILDTDGAGQKSLFAQCLSVVPFIANKDKSELKLLHVFCPDRKKRHWAFPGGDIIRGADTCIYDSARREFQEELGVFFGRDWAKCFEAPLPREGTDSISDPNNLLYVSVEKDGVRYPCRPTIFAQVSEEFYEASRTHEDDHGVIKLPKPAGESVRYDDLEMANRVHLDGLAFTEHDEARWLNLDFETGRLWSDDSRQVRKENAEFLKSQPDKIWRFFAQLLGRDMPEKATMLPANFDTNGPFAVRISGIDKTAQNSDVEEFFESGGIIKTTLVKQFDVPKHTARVEFETVTMLEEALGLSGRMLLRRKLKVELWTEVGADEATADAPGAAPLKEYVGPLPQEAPFKATCRGLDRTVTRDCLGYFFWDRACMVHDVEFPMKNEKHSGCVEFTDQESLRKALSLNNGVFRGREMTIELYDPNAPPPPSGGRDNGRDRDDKGGRRDKGGGKGKGKRDNDRGYGGGGGGFDREPPSREEFGSERPRLQLKPRSTSDTNPPAAPSDDRPSGRSDPFGGQGGGARPDPFGGARNQDARSDPFGGQRTQNDRPPPPRRDEPRRDAPEGGKGLARRDEGGGKGRDERFSNTRADSDSNWRR